EMHTDAVTPGQRVLLIDDLIATGGTVVAAMKLLQGLGANVVEATTIIDLPYLGGADAVRATGTPLFSICSFDDSAVPEEVEESDEDDEDVDGNIEQQSNPDQS